MITKRGAGSENTSTFIASARNLSLLKLMVLGEAAFNPEFYLCSASLQS